MSNALINLVWDDALDSQGRVRFGLAPLAGETVVTPGGIIGTAHHTLPGLTPLSWEYRYVVPEHDDESVVLCHRAQLRSFAAATEIA
jgi:hypothetical protein